LVPLKIVSNVSRLKPALNLNRVLADLNHGSNSLNSISGYKKKLETQFELHEKGYRIQNTSSWCAQDTGYMV